MLPHFRQLRRRSVPVAQTTSATWCSAQSSPSLNGEIGLVNQLGHFAWYELLTTDVAAAGAFYGQVVGWGAKDVSTPELAYTVLTAGEVPVGGLMDLPEEGRRMGATQDGQLRRSRRH